MCVCKRVELYNLQEKRLLLLLMMMMRRRKKHPGPSASLLSVLKASLEFQRGLITTAAAAAAGSSNPTHYN